MFSRSPSSSPDILGPSGDADYLISSPFVPFSGRQSFMSPANFRLLQSPRTAKGKRRSRASLSPSKSAHSIKFNDVVLPASPTMKLNGQQSGMPPDTVQPDGNVSPWRIRVTLEATQDEGTNQGSPVRKRLKPSTTTMKVPLKDDIEQTPRKRRGRPRKSDTLVQDATPRAGSPGHTPGPGGTGQKRKRGRPRKSQPLDVAGQGQQPLEHQGDEHEAPIIEPEQRWSPLNLAADMGSDDDIPGDQEHDFDTPVAHEGQTVQPDMAVYDRSSPRVTFEPTFDTPNVDNVDQGFTENDEYNLNSTPSKMPSPTRDSQIISPTNTLYAGRTPRPPRIYPTPTSSSVAEEEKTEQARKTNATHAENRRESGLYPTIDPTGEHTEFDSIMESEGFSMVSLDTLPSAKQHEFKKTSHQQAAKSALKPFLERESNGVLKRRASVINQDHGEHTSSQKTQLDSRSRSQLSAQVPPQFGRVDSYWDRPSSESRLDSAKNISALSVAVPEATSARKERRPLARLVRIVRAGFALEGPLRSSEEEQISHLPGSGIPRVLGDQDSLLDASRQRLELLFGDFAPEVQKELRAGLAFGQELAKRRRQGDMERHIQNGVGEVNARNILRGNREASGSRSPQQTRDEATHSDTPGTFMRRRMEEWQREREAISREIQMANSSQVIVLDSDDNDQSNVQDDRYEVGDEPEYESKSTSDEDAHVESERLDDEDEDDGYEDIWQQEAHSQGNHSDHLSLLEDDHTDTDPGQDESSPWKAGWTPARNRNAKIVSPAHWTNEQEQVPFLGRSRVKQLQEQEVDLTSLYRTQDTPKRNHYYYGESSPLNSTIRGSVRRPPVSSVQQETYEHVSDQDRQSEGYVESSPHRDSDDETFQIDPTTRLEIARQRHEPGIEDDEIESMSDAAAAEGQPPSATGDITPEHPRHASPDNQASSWFQRITNFTPGWLRAPNSEQQGLLSEKTSGDEENDESPTIKPTHDRGGHNEEVNWVDLDESPRPLQFGEPEDEQQSFLGSESFQVVDDVRASLDKGVGEREEKAESQTPGDQSLSSVSVYFSNDHYRLLHHLYRSAKLYPERFPYHPAPGRSDMIGDWIWTSDGVYGVPVTELQFAIIDRFAQQLSQADMKAGGTGQISWTEADVHRRLISIIIGEQIRQERKQRLHEDRLRVEHSRNRDAVYETWRI
ncbi:hypothetical protein ASPCADRAFT_161395 [Aspergillus carbonarius ITEM 5010]|uniref:AT DNA binding protein n=1 Tax=Aspergillus carbonarius (strain ITEM 5010) TaxID=602072 RepID=A0A1R3RZW3_ASPC5|nr:hypothetical protein ASPCADRAFT_161395 [Aspergillus carbonarius ITEM 5010]